MKKINTTLKVVKYLTVILVCFGLDLKIEK